MSLSFCNLASDVLCVNIANYKFRHCIFVYQLLIFISFPSPVVHVFIISHMLLCIIIYIFYHSQQHWAEEIPKFKSPDGGAKITLWNGQLQGHTGLTPPINSYASHPDSETAVILIELSPGASYTIPAAQRGNKVNRMAYFIEGKNLDINTEKIKNHSAITLKAEIEATFTNSHSTEQTDILILQGVPINEPVAQHGPFVMNTQQEIQQAFADYRKTQFGGWPWPDDAMVFPREKGRFALVNGIETHPPSTAIGSNEL